MKSDFLPHNLACLLKNINSLIYSCVFVSTFFNTKMIVLSRGKQFASFVKV